MEETIRDYYDRYEIHRPIVPTAKGAKNGFAAPFSGSCTSVFVCGEHTLILNTPDASVFRVGAPTLWCREAQKLCGKNKSVLRYDFKTPGLGEITNRHWAEKPGIADTQWKAEYGRNRIVYVEFRAGDLVILDDTFNVDSTELPVLHKFEVLQSSQVKLKRMGRPPKPESEVRSKHFNAYFTQAQFEDLQNKAKSLGISMTMLITNVLKDAKIIR